MEEDFEFDEFDKDDAPAHDTIHEETVLWHAPEFTYHEKSADWYWVLGIVVVIGALIAVVVGNILFAILIVIGGFAIGMYASKHPDMLTCELTRKGVHVNDKRYPFSSIKSFWVDDERDGKHKLLITLKRHLAMHVIIPVEGINPNVIRNYLLDHIDEEEQHESITEYVIEFFKL